MRVLFLCEGTTIPATRFRVEQFVPKFHELGLVTEIRYGYGNGYNQWTGRTGDVKKLGGRLGRLVKSLDAGQYDVVFLQRPTLPQHPFPEKLVCRLNPNTVFDYDDSIWLGPNGQVAHLREYTFKSIIARVAHLTAGNQFLARQAGSPEKTTVIPTVIDADKYVPRNRSEGPIVIGWMGTAGNFGFLERIVPSLNRVLAKNPKVVLRLVSNQTFGPLAGHPQVEQVRWRPETEVALLQSFDIGLMPLVQSPLTEGKCAFKMIQYMSVGRPVVVSRVGANVEVFGDGTDGPGFLEPDFDWDESLQSLIDDEKLRANMGDWGRERVVDSYSLHAAVPLYLSVFERVANY